MRGLYGLLYIKNVEILKNSRSDFALCKSLLLFFYVSVLLLDHNLFAVDDIQAGQGWLLIESAAIQHIPVCG